MTKIIKNLFITLIFMVITLKIALRHKLVNAEYFSSVDKLQDLINVNLDLTKIFLDYLKQQNLELEKFGEFIEDVKFEHSVANEDEGYFENPINAFKLIKRLTVDWHQLHSFINESDSYIDFIEKMEIFKEGGTLPEDNELLEAAKSLARLQNVYDLKTDDLSNGIINGINYGTKLNWHDCFEIGVNLYDQKDFKLALNWFEEALKKLNALAHLKKDSFLHNFKVECLEYLVLTNYRLGYADTAFNYIQKLQYLVPKHNMKNIRSYILNYQPEKSEIKRKLNIDTYKNYTLLCQGKQVPEKKFSKLKCKLDTLNRPYFMLAPLKVEQINLEPDIKLYHAVLNDEQIERIVLEAKNKLGRSKLGNGDTSDLRVSQGAWLGYESPAMRTIFNLVSNITGLNVTNSEEMQMVNYGIGGQYDFHTDYFGAGFDHPRYIGDRIVTNMFYLSDVEEGGYTVFPKLNIFLRPIKGALIIWYNLFKSLDHDLRTLHAGCPVIKGSKRIGNVWVHSGFQEFQRPCGLKNDKK